MNLRCVRHPASILYLFFQRLSGLRQTSELLLGRFRSKQQREYHSKDATKSPGNVMLFSYIPFWHGIFKT